MLQSILLDDALEQEQDIVLERDLCWLRDEPENGLEGFLQLSRGRLHVNFLVDDEAQDSAALVEDDA